MTAISGRLVAQTRIRGIPHFVASAADLQTLAQGEDPQGLIGIAARATISLNEADAHSGVWLALESVRKPGNLGSMLRTAQAAGARGCIAVGDAMWTSSIRRAVRASMGAFWQQASGARPLGRIIRVSRAPSSVLAGNFAARRRKLSRAEISARFMVVAGRRTQRTFATRAQSVRQTGLYSGQFERGFAGRRRRGGRDAV